MLSLLGFLTIVVFLLLIILKKLSVVTALVIVPLVFGLLAGFNIKDVSVMMFDGIKQVAPTGILLMFAVLYFGTMLDYNQDHSICKRRSIESDHGHRYSYHDGSFGWGWYSHLHDRYLGFPSCLSTT